MKARALGVFVLSAALATAMLVGCGGTTSPPVPTQGAAPEGHSPALPGAQGRDLLYVTGGSTTIYTFPKGKLISTLGVTGGAMCSNSAGDVFITMTYGVAEYPHGSATQIAFIPSPAHAYSCSIDPTTGNLAIVFEGSGSIVVAIYRRQLHNRWHRPQVYSFAQPQEACTYDTAGNLFVGGFASGSGFSLSELPKGHSAFETISLDTNVIRQGDLQWDGQYLAIGDGTDNAVIHRFAIQGTHGKQVGSLTLLHVKDIYQFWIQGNILIGPDGLKEDVGFWRYPQGGAPFKKFTKDSPSGVTVSTVR